MKPLLTLLLTVMLLPDAATASERTRVAVASNFYETLQLVQRAFQDHTPEARIDLIAGSTGKLYAQIKAGAPYHLFFAADSERPALLEKEGHVAPGQRYTYAEGILALWTPGQALKDRPGDQLLAEQGLEKLAMANPKVAPYGRASLQFLKTLPNFDDLSGKLVYGENVGQAFHFAQARAADFAFLSLAQVKGRAGSHWVPDAELYQSIHQQVILLSDTPQARAFFEFTRSPQAKRIIAQAGYRIP